MSNVSSLIDEKKPEEYFVDGKFVPYLLSQDIMAITDFHTLKSTGELYRFAGNVWKPDGESFIKDLCRRALGEKEKDHYVNEVISSIRQRNYVEQDRMGWPDGTIHVENGLLDLETRELREFNSKVFSTTKIPVEYNPEARCPKIMKFLEETLMPDDVNTIVELIGYCLIRDYPIHRAFMFTGSGANGKSTLIELIRRFLGEENTSSVGLKELTEQRFATADLFGKLANLHADLPSDAMKKTGPFKMATGMDTLRAEKKYKDSFQFRNTAKMIFSANKVPAATDDTVAFYRRWKIIEFPHTFTGSDADPNILEKITTSEELSGLLNIALDAVERLLERGEFYKSEKIEERKRRYIRASNPVQAFVEDKVEREANSYLVFRDLYNEYKKYCNKHGLDIQGPRSFGGNFQKYQSVEKRRKTIDGDRKSCYVGIRVKESDKNRSLTEDEEQQTL